MSGRGGRQEIEERCRCHDADVLERIGNQKILVAGNDDIGSALYGRRQHDVVVWIARGRGYVPWSDNLECGHYGAQKMRRMWFGQDAGDPRSSKAGTQFIHQ